MSCFFSFFICAPPSRWQMSRHKMSRTLFLLSQTQPFLPPLGKEEKGWQETRGIKGKCVRGKDSKERCLGSSSIHLVSDDCFSYCNLMALLSPGATRQSPLYHMAIISVALFCDSLTLSTVMWPLIAQPDTDRMWACVCVCGLLCDITREIVGHWGEIKHGQLKLKCLISHPPYYLVVFSFFLLYVVIRVHMNVCVCVCAVDLQNWQKGHLSVWMSLCPSNRGRSFLM